MSCRCQDMENRTTRSQHTRRPCRWEHPSDSWTWEMKRIAKLDRKAYRSSHPKYRTGGEA